MLCTTLPSASLDEAKVAFRKIKTPLAELRLDLIKGWSVEEVERNFDCSKLVIKSLSKFEELALLSPRYLDIGNLVKVAEIKRLFPRLSVIYSYHDFEGMPDVEAILRDAKSSGADLIKIAVHVSSTLEALKLLQLQKREGESLIAIGMGEEGVLTRLIGLKFGMPISYCAFDKNSRAAPGQLTYDEMEQIYFASQIDSKTLLFGLIGSPVSQSIGELHNQLMLPQNGRYFKMRVESEELDETLFLLKEIGFSGLSVTMPLKKQISKEGPINTLRRSVEEPATAEWKAANTDGKGAVAAIFRHLTPTSVAILGTGGAGEALFQSLRECEIPCRMVPRKELNGTLFTEQLIVNATPSACPIDLHFVPKSSWIMEMTTSPKETELLQKAKKRGNKVIYGYEMWAHQAALQLQFWLEMNPLESAKKLLDLAERLL